MSRLRIFNDSDPNLAQFDSRDGEQIAAELSKIGVTFERWQATQPIEPGATPEQVMAAYREDIERLSAERGLKTVDVVSIAPDNPKREEMRAKFLDERLPQGRRGASSSPARASSHCTWTTRSTRSNASRTT